MCGHTIYFIGLCFSGCKNDSISGSTHCGVFAGDFIPIGIGHCPVMHLLVENANNTLHKVYRYRKLHFKVLFSYSVLERYRHTISCCHKMWKV